MITVPFSDFGAKSLMSARANSILSATPAFNIERDEVAHYFRDIFAISADCRFNNCTHTHEPGCAVLQALEEHRLAPSRYASYLSMMDDQDEGKYRAAY